MPRLLGQHESTLEVRGMIISMWEGGVPKHEISERVDLSPFTRRGRISSGYWGWMSSAGPGELARISPHFTAAEYVDVLENVMLPTVRAIYPDNNIVFVHDNSPVHTARIVREWFEEHEDIQAAAAVRNWENEENIRTVDVLHYNVMRVWEQLRGTGLIYAAKTTRMYR
ncbi:hypothetical protein ILUMI_22636 [Ignelater luminosus]|uniref:Tc1-like transposase DDE domain-containing protein n=1 Tax=Ignelater luminosus TaxID=2038154 RepID=A0A8K0G0D6_IGNLU|nr:hypothetical protein ILUMI_22636 [Ignelater luminosus]